MKLKYNLLILAHRYEKLKGYGNFVNPFHIKVQLVLEEITGNEKKYGLIEESNRQELSEKDMGVLLKYTGQGIGRDISILAREIENKNDMGIKIDLLSKIGFSDFNYEINQIKFFNGMGLTKGKLTRKDYKNLTGKEYNGLMQGFAEWGYEKVKKKSLISRIWKR